MVDIYTPSPDFTNNKRKLILEFSDKEIVSFEQNIEQFISKLFFIPRPDITADDEKEIIMGEKHKYDTTSFDRLIHKEAAKAYFMSVAVILISWLLVTGFEIQPTLGLLAGPMFLGFIQLYKSKKGGW